MNSRSIGVMAAAVLAVVAVSGAGLPVTYERLLKADQEPGNWLMYSGNYSSWRFSKLDQINRKNIGQLHTAWTYHSGDAAKGNGSTIECTPIVIDGVMYLTTAKSKVVALDADTGCERWEFDSHFSIEDRKCVSFRQVLTGCRTYLAALDILARPAPA